MIEKRTLEERVRDLRTRIRLLESRMEESHAWNRKELFREFSDLRSKHEQFLERIQTSRRAGGEAWNSFEDELEHRLEELTRTVDRIASRLELDG